MRFKKFFGKEKEEKPVVGKKPVVEKKVEKKPEEVKSKPKPSFDFFTRFFKKKKANVVKDVKKEIKKEDKKLEKRDKEKEKYKAKILNLDKILASGKKKAGSIKKKRYHMLQHYLQKAGYEIDPLKLAKRVFNATLLVTILITVYFLFRLSLQPEFEIRFLIFMLIMIWGIAFSVVFFLIWLLLFFLLDMKMFRRAKEIERVLPDYLQLTAANINSGMPIDKALWFAVRPRFGVLAKEIELVAKEVMSGVELAPALTKFVDKYDSKILKRSINLLMEGIDAGGQVGDLLNRIALDIKETQLMKEEMAASVSNYTIFITFASIVAAPILLALSSRLLFIIKNVVSQVDLPKNISNLSFSISEITLSITDYNFFAFGMLVVTSVFSSIIISVIMKGDIKSGTKYILPYIVVSILIYLGASAMFGAMIGSLF